MSKQCNNDDVGSDCQWWLDGACEHVETCGEPRKTEPLKQGEHTPGPWESFNHYVWTTDKQNIANCKNVQDGNPMTPQESWANARLIAAAPMLLEACQEALDCATVTSDIDLTIERRNSVISKLEAAIKATE